MIAVYADIVLEPLVEINMSRFGNLAPGYERFVRCGDGVPIYLRHLAMQRMMQRMMQMGGRCR